MTRIISHRGYHTHDPSIPENSIPAFENALKYEADGLELDVHLTKDHHLVVYHDYDLSKLGSTQIIREAALEEVLAVELMPGITIPSLEEVLDQFAGKCFLNIEVKSKEPCGQVLVDQLESSGIIHDTECLVVSSFETDRLKELHGLDPAIPTGLLCHLARNEVRKAQQLGCVALNPYFDKIPRQHAKRPRWFFQWLVDHYSGKAITEALGKGLRVNPWTVNSEEYLTKLFEVGVSGVITDEVPRAVKIRSLIH